MKQIKDNSVSAVIPVDYISNSDCIDGMKELTDNCVDLVIADPPYNLSKSGDWKWDNSVSLAGMGGNWNITNENWDNMSFDDYFNFSLAWLKEAKRILKPTGSMWIFGTYHNIGIINVACQLLGIEIINEVIWYKKNAFPNLSGRRMTASHETILWTHSGGKKRTYYFDYDYSKNGEFPGDELKVVGKQMRTVWDLSNNKKAEELKYGKHPTQKPIKVLTRMIKLSSKPGDIMLTPFSGAGSECVAAKMTGRHYIGFEIEKKYCDISEERLTNAEVKSEQLNIFQIPQEEIVDDKTGN
ncbi:MAG: site-specific DNA-methyltransferase [Candidatus Gastranaerophilales bacterium]|nr:site-specific DNA-methyltransferase [Candidatus Gastranaerophilales bacterium]